MIFHHKIEAKPPHKPNLFYPIRGNAWASFIFLAPFKETGPKPCATWAPAPEKHQAFLPFPTEIMNSKPAGIFRGSGGQTWCGLFWEIISEHPKMQFQKTSKSNPLKGRFVTENALRNDGDCHWLGDEFPETFISVLTDQPKRSTIYSVPILQKTHTPTWGPILHENPAYRTPSSTWIQIIGMFDAS